MDEREGEGGGREGEEGGRGMLRECGERRWWSEVEEEREVE